jgi:hypothetical protein
VTGGASALVGLGGRGGWRSEAFVEESQVLLQGGDLGRQGAKRLEQIEQFRWEQGRFR